MQRRLVFQRNRKIAGRLVEPVVRTVDAKHRFDRPLFPDERQQIEVRTETMSFDVLLVDFRFIIFLLLIPFVHREDSIGMRARDGLLLCMSLSKKNKNVATYIVEHSNFAVLAATGLNGLYSLLPNVLDDTSVPDWRRLTPDDVNDIKGLSTFVTSLEFSNAVAQVAHPTIRKQLQEFLFGGFLVPVLGPALLQTNVNEQVAATAYLELILRTLTQPGLLYALLKFLINMDYDGHRLLEILIQRINSDGELCLVFCYRLSPRLR
jgi:hypothetical protein